MSHPSLQGGAPARDPRDPRFAHHENIVYLVVKIAPSRPSCRCGEMVDTGDLKSPARNRACWFESSRRHHSTRISLREMLAHGKPRAVFPSESNDSERTKRSAVSRRAQHI